MAQAAFARIADARRVDKPWGYELIWAETEGYVGKVIHIYAGRRLSLQYHDQKLETQMLIAGRAKLIADGPDGALDEVEMMPWKGYTIRPYQRHRLVAIDDCDVIEASTPEAGVTVRLADDYRRPDETEELRGQPDRGWALADSESHSRAP
ncbi:MAG: cupin [Dehalococcoidia bacterium]|nr:cupin [Dehalococcoidia bacterium]